MEWKAEVAGGYEVEDVARAVEEWGRRSPAGMGMGLREWRSAAGPGLGLRERRGWIGGIEGRRWLALAGNDGVCQGRLDREGSRGKQSGGGALKQREKV